MPGIHLYSSNRLELLADRLARIISDDPLDPLEREIIVVEPIGMERWLSQQLSLRLGVWANCEYPFPNRMIQYLFTLVLGDEAVQSLPAEEEIRWRMFSLLPQLAREKDFPELQHYLAGGESQLKRYQLAERLTDTFSQYLAYRPAMMLEWENKNEKGWQARLWRRLLEGAGRTHRGRMLADFVQKLGSPDLFAGYQLPRRISMFGISSLPRLHLEALRALSAHGEINVFFLNPCREYWGEVKNERERFRMEQRMPGEDLYLEKGNSLLASLGRTGRDFLTLLLEMDPFLDPLEDWDGPGAGGEAGMLRVVQNDILSMVERGASSGHDRFGIENPPALALSPEALAEDGTIRVASCHSPMREVEALYDYLLDLFNCDPTLEPGDIAIMTPSIETYAPLVQAVFGSPEKEHEAVPVAVADRTFRDGSRMASAFMDILEMAPGRFEAGGVLDLLQCAEIRRRFDIDDYEIETIVRWVRETGIRWGIDAAHRRDLGLPALGENTWRSGIDRLLLGYALPGGDRELYREILPYDHVEGSNAATLGKFVEFFDALCGCAAKLNLPQKTAEWRALLTDLMEKLFLSDEDGGEGATIKDIIGRFDDEHRKAGCTEIIEPEVLRHWLRNEMDERKTLKNFLSGAVTVCAMRPMRSIPFRVICLLGMDDGVFPRNPPAPGFDIIASSPVRGDRSIRDEDRFLFLETLISARERLYISYRGQSLRDNTPLPPSPVVSELLDYCDRAFQIEGGSVREHLSVTHPLQAFSPRYFSGDSGLYSYSRMFCAASSERPAADMEKPFIESELPELPPGEIPLGLLLRFFSHPARTFLEERLGMRPVEKDVSLEEKEPFELSGIDRYVMGNELCGDYLEGRPMRQRMPVYRAAGRLPLGVPGEALFEQMLPAVEDFAGNVMRCRGGDKREPVDIRLEYGRYYVSGSIDGLYKGGHIIHDYGKGGGARRLRAWILHLVLNAANGASGPMNTAMVCSDGVWLMAPCADAREILRMLVEIFLRGMRKPPAFYPKTSFAYALELHDKGDRERALAGARSAWAGERYTGAPEGEGADPAVRLTTGGVLNMEGEFMRLAESIYFPLLERQEKK